MVLGAILLVGALAPCGLLAVAGLRRLAMLLWCRLGLWVLSVRVSVTGKLPPGGSLIAANHISYVDILILGAYCPGVFVAKSEIAGWPLFGFAARLAGALFIERTRPRAVARSLGRVKAALAAGSRVLLFPEGGIVSRGGEVTRFHSMFFDREAVGGRQVVPTAIKYVKPTDPAVWAWTDHSSPVSHAYRNLARGAPVLARLIFGDPLEVGGDDERRTVAHAAHDAVVKLMEEAN